MKMKLLKSIGLASLLAIVPGVRAEIIYNNSMTDTTFRLMATNNQQIGDQIIMAGTARFLTNFSIEYYSPNLLFSGSVQADVAFYLNNGTLFNGYASPNATPFFDTGFNAIQPPSAYTVPATNVGVLNFDLRNDPLSQQLLPTNFTLVVTFRGLVGPADQAGVALFNPVTVGQNTPDYWLNTPSGWQLLTNSATPVNFGARFDATVPEPSVIGLSLLGGIAALATARRRKGRN